MGNESHKVQGRATTFYLALLHIQRRLLQFHLATDQTPLSQEVSCFIDDLWDTLRILDD